MRVTYFFYERCGPWPHPQSLPDPSADPMIRPSISCQLLQPLLLPTMPSRGTCPTRLLRMLLIPVAAVVIARLEPENQEDTDIIIKSVEFACFNYHFGGLETSVN